MSHESWSSATRFRPLPRLKREAKVALGVPGVPGVPMTTGPTGPSSRPGDAAPSPKLSPAESRDRCYGQLIADAQGVAKAVEQRAASVEHVFVLCRDRYHFAAALLGVWQAGREAWLPDAQTAMGVQTAGQIVLHDHDDEMPGPRGVGDSGADVWWAGEWQAGVSLPQLWATRDDALPSDLDPLDSERILVRLHTSGTTGRSQAVTKRTRQLFAEAELLVQSFGLGAQDRILASVPPEHIYGLLFGILVPLSAGAAFVRDPPSLTSSLPRTAEAVRASVLVSVPPHLRVFVEQQTAPLPRIRRVISSGAPLPPATADLIRRQLSAELSEVLGSTETGGIALRGDPKQDWQALPGVQVFRAESGRLRVRSDFIDDPREAYLASDRIELLGPGRFRHLGREDDVVKVGAKRVSLARVERAARELPGVVDAAALAVPVDQLRQTEVWLAVEAPSWSRASLRKALSLHLEPVSLPRRVRIVRELPRTERGKLARDRLRLVFEQADATDPSRLPQLRLLAAANEQRGAFAVQVPKDCSRFDGHFPEAPRLPGVSLLHDVVLAAIRQRWSDLSYVSGAPRVKFTAAVSPGDSLELELERRADQVRFRLSRRGELCALGQLSFSESRPDSS